VKEAGKRLKSPHRVTAERSGCGGQGRSNKTGTLIEDLGVDQLFVDEPDLYKRGPIAYYDVEIGTRIAGLPNSDRNRGILMVLRLDNLQDGIDGRGVVFAHDARSDGTPLAEMLRRAALSARA